MPLMLDHVTYMLHALYCCSWSAPALCCCAGNVNTQPIDWMADVLWAGKDCYLGEASVHY
jgi:hypothetical protein